MLRNEENYYPTIVVGAGPSGLAAAYCLQKNKIKYTIIEGSSRVANSWHYVWEDFKLAQKASDVTMIGLNLARDFGPDHRLKRNEIITAFENYAKDHRLEIKFNIHVKSIKKDTLGMFEIETSNGIFNATNVVLGLGARQQPKYPECITSDIQQSYKNIIMHSAWYQNAKTLVSNVSDKIPEGKILVVGSGLSALNITENLSYQQNIRYKVSIACSYNDDEIAQNNKHLPSIPVKLTKLKENGIKNFGKLLACGENADNLKFSTKKNPIRINDYTKIIFATGYSYAYDLLFKLLDNALAEKILGHNQGVTEESGLYVVGIPIKGEKTVTITQGSLEAENVTLHILQAKKNQKIFISSTVEINKVISVSNDAIFEEPEHVKLSANEEKNPEKKVKFKSDLWHLNDMKLEQANHNLYCNQKNNNTF